MLARALLDHATVTVRTSASGGQAIALITDGDDIVIKNGSIVDARSRKANSRLQSLQKPPAQRRGRTHHRDSVVKAITRYVESGSDGPDHYSNDQSGEVIPEPRGSEHRYLRPDQRGHHARDYFRSSAARSLPKETRRRSSPRCHERGRQGNRLHRIEGSTILTPEGGKVVTIATKKELSNGDIYEAGQTIGTGDAVIDSPYNEAVAKSTVIVPPEESNPRRSQARPSRGFQVRGHEDNQDRCSCSHGSQDHRQARGNRRRLERSHRGSRPCREQRHRRRRRGESQACIDASIFNARGGTPEYAPSPHAV